VLKIPKVSLTESNTVTESDRVLRLHLWCVASPSAKAKHRIASLPDLSCHERFGDTRALLAFGERRRARRRTLVVYDKRSQAFAEGGAPRDSALLSQFSRTKSRAPSCAERRKQVQAVLISAHQISLLAERPPLLFSSHRRRRTLLFSSPKANSSLLIAEGELFSSHRRRRTLLFSSRDKRRDALLSR